MVQVFSAEWFDAYQPQLLRLANSWAGRRLLRIHGQRSGVGRRRITRIEPHAITWQNPDGSFTYEARSHAKYAKRLYYGLKPVWYLLHAWDMAIANNLTQTLNVGFDSLTAYPQAGQNNTTVDGVVTNAGGVGGLSFGSLRGGSGTSASSLDGYIDVELLASSTTNQFGLLDRSIMTFDTSSLSANASISAATVNVNGIDKWNGLGTPALHIASASPVNMNSLTPSDFVRVGTTSFANVSYASFSSSGYNILTLDSNGRNNISETAISAYSLQLSWDILNSFTGTWTSNDFAYFLITSADATGSSNDPYLTVTFKTVRATSPSGTLLVNSSPTAKTKHKTTAGGVLAFGAIIQPSKKVATVAGKDYVYRVYDADNNYIGMWPDVVSLPNWQQRLNTPGTTTTVTLARSADRTSEQRDTIADQTGDTLTTESSESLIATYDAGNTVGEGTDVELNYNVDIYVHYGTFDDLTTEGGEELWTESSEQLLVAVGAPLGRRVFSGFILDYSANYAEKDSVDVTLASNGFELSNEVIRSGTTTTVTFSSTEHGAIMKNIISTNPGAMTYTASTIGNTAQTMSDTYRLNTKLEGIQSVFNQSPDGWYWYGNVADNSIYFNMAGATADHTFIFGKHIGSINVKRSMETLRNKIYFVGGDTGGGILYKSYSDATSIANWRQGIYRITDRRYTLLASALNYANKVLNQYAAPIYTTSVRIPSEVYEIEEIQLGQMVGFANFDNFVDDLVLQIMAISYSPYLVTLELGGLLDRQQDIIAGTNQDLQTEQYETIPSAPS